MAPKRSVYRVHFPKIIPTNGFSIGDGWSIIFNWYPPHHSNIWTKWFNLHYMMNLVVFFLFPIIPYMRIIGDMSNMWVRGDFCESQYTDFMGNSINRRNISEWTLAGTPKNNVLPFTKGMEQKNNQGIVLFVHDYSFVPPSAIPLGDWDEHTIRNTFRPRGRSGI